MDVFDALAQARGRGEDAVLVTVLAVSGDAPSHAGAKLVVGTQGVLAGTLGCSEYDAAGADLAAEALAATEPVRRQLDVSEAHSRHRSIELFAEVHRPVPAVLVLGSTPVGRAVADLARSVDRRAVLVAPGGDVSVSSGVAVRADDPARALIAGPPGASDAVVVSDHDAPWVDEVLRVALASDAFFVGMLGSRRHAPAAVRRLRDAGVPEEHVQRLQSPCGLDIGSRTPGEIALSIVAQIVATERGREGGPMTL